MAAKIKEIEAMIDQMSAVGERVPGQDSAASPRTQSHSPTSRSRTKGGSPGKRRGKKEEGPAKKRYVRFFFRFRGDVFATESI